MLRSDNSRELDYDICVVGAGIAGMESALSLGEMGYRVLLVEREASVGGKMILLSKVFPTLDCASCISTPKMASSAHHPNVTLMVYSEIDQFVRKDDGRFLVRMHKKPTYVNPDACTGCGQCETACTVAIADEFNFGLSARRAAHIPFPQAVPKKAVIERAGQSPCSHTCPAGVKPHGYASLVRAGLHDAAFELHLEATPLIGSLSRACYAPCEGQCTRSDFEGCVPLRAIKRFMADRYYERYPEPKYGPPSERKGKRVAIVGSGPAGLTAAFQLGKKGYDVTVFEGRPKAGGMMRYGMPAYRLPKEVLDRDIKNVTALGVEIRTNSPVDSLARLRQDGFDAVFVGAGAGEARSMGIPGEDLPGVMDCMAFLREKNEGDGEDLLGKTLLVVGGGNSAIDPVRLAIRKGKKLGAARVILQYRRGRSEMPAHEWEVRAAEEEGVELQLLKNPLRFLGRNGRLAAVESQTMALGEPDSSGRHRPVPVEGTEEMIPVDMAVLAIGLAPSTGPFAKELELRPNGVIRIDDETLQTSLPYVFAGGDAVVGPLNMTEAIGQGNRAAFFIDRFLQGQSLDTSYLKGPQPVDRLAVVARAARLSSRKPTQQREVGIEERLRTMVEVELPFSEEEARYSANRCLDCGGCSECHQCVHVCPANAIDFSMQPEEHLFEVGAVVLATGFELFNAHLKPAFGYGKYPNVITAMQMDRLLAPTRPFNAVLRPSDGKEPDNIAFVLCTGSRDAQVNHRLCSRVCCMYTAKQAQLIMGALPLADVTIYYIDIRAFGKGYDEFYEQAKGMGVNFVHGKVAGITESEETPGNMVVRFENIAEGKLETREHDLVVLSVGLLPNPDVLKMFQGMPLEADSFRYIKEIDEDIEPGVTSIEGVFAAGATTAARDIPDTILHSGAAAAQAAAYVERLKGLPCEIAG